MSRVITYIDGFNLYFGMKNYTGNQYLWLNLEALSTSFILPEDQLIDVKYFTARIKGDEPKRKRQKTYLEALAFGTATKTYFGQYQVIKNGITCQECGASWDAKSEKMTDVQIATHLLVDAFTDKFDRAVLITADSDLVPPIKMIKDHFPQKQIHLMFPPQRFSYQLQEVADVYETIDVADLGNNQLPITIKKPDGFVLQKPITWI